MRNLVSRLKKVVLPAPFGPISAWISPRRTRRSTSFTATKPLNSFVRPRVWRMKSSAGCCAVAKRSSPLCSAPQSIGSPRDRSSELTGVRALHGLEAHSGECLDERIEFGWPRRAAIGSDDQPIQVPIDDHVGEARITCVLGGALLTCVDHRPGAVAAEGGGCAERLRLDAVRIAAIEQRTVVGVGNIT